MALTRSLKVYNGSDATPVTDVTDRTDWPQTELSVLANLGDAAAGQWLMRDEGGTIPDFVAPGELVDSHNVIVATVGSNTLFRGRIAADDHFRGRQKAGRAKEITFTLEDQNSHLRGMIVHEWIRPAETDAARAQALVAAYLSGNYRPTTNLNGSNLIITGSNAISLPAKTYSGVTPYEVMQELASNADKEMFVTVDNELAYFGHDYTGYVSLLRISDDPADANANTYAPWDPHGAEVGRNKLSALRSYFGSDVTQSTIRVTNANDPRFDFWEDVFWDSESVTPEQAEARAQKMLDYRSVDDVNYTCTIGPMSGDEIWKIKPGQQINFKSRAARGGRNANGTYSGDNFLTTRVRQINWTMPDEDRYKARLELEKPKRASSPGQGNQALAVMPKPAPQCAVADPGGIGDPAGPSSPICAVTDGHTSCGADACQFGGTGTVTTYEAITPGDYYSQIDMGFKYAWYTPGSFTVEIHDTTATLPNYEVTLWSGILPHGNYFNPPVAPCSETVGGVFTVETGYDQVRYKLGTRSGGYGVVAGSHETFEYTYPAPAADGDPYCVDYDTSGIPHDSPYFKPSDAVQFEIAGLNEQIADLQAGLVGGSGVTVADILSAHRFPLAAHRGDIGSVDSFPEDSVEAIVQAAQKGVEIIEWDAVASSDGTFWGSHDTTVDRVTASSGAISGKTDATLGGYSYNDGYGYDSGRHGSSIGLSTLDEICTALLPYGCLLKIELKGGTAEDLATAVVAAGFTQRTILEVSSLADAASIKGVSAQLTTLVNQSVSGSETDDNVDWLSWDVDTMTSLAATQAKAPKVVAAYASIDDYGSDEQSQFTLAWNYGARSFQTNNVDDAIKLRNSKVYGAPGTSDTGRWEPLTSADATAPEIVFDSGGDVVMIWVTD